MKNVTKFLIIALSAVLILSSCKKDKGEDPIVEEPIVEEPVVLTPEQHKANLEATGIEFVNEVEGLASLSAAAAADDLYGLTNTSGGLKSTVNKLGIIKVLAGLNDGTKGSHVKGFLKAEAKLKGDVADAMDSIEGIYTWNPSISEFDYVAANNQVIINFPSETSVTNNCQLTYAVTLVNTSDQITGLTEMPSQVSSSMTVNSVEVASYSLTASYDAQGVPSNVTSILEADSYTWQITLTKSPTKISSDFLFAHGTTTLINYGTEVGGNLNFNEIDTYVTSLDSISAFEQGKITQAGTYIQDVKMYFQVLDIKLVESANTTNFAADLEDIIIAEDNGSITEDQATNQLVAAINDNVNIYLMYVEDSTKIADAQLLVQTVQDEPYISYEWNPVTQQYEEVTITNSHKEPSFRFIFEDGSSIDAETYFETGFEDAQAEMEAMVAEFEATFDNVGQDEETPTY